MDLRRAPLLKSFICHSNPCNSAPYNFMEYMQILHQYHRISVKFLQTTQETVGMHAKHFSRAGGISEVTRIKQNHDWNEQESDL